MGGVFNARFTIVDEIGRTAAFKVMIRMYDRDTCRCHPIGCRYGGGRGLFVGCSIRRCFYNVRFGDDLGHSPSLVNKTSHGLALVVLETKGGSLFELEGGVQSAILDLLKGEGRACSGHGRKIVDCARFDFARGHCCCHHVANRGPDNSGFNNDNRRDGRDSRSQNICDSLCSRMESLVAGNSTMLPPPLNCNKVAEENGEKQKSTHD